MSNNMNYFSSSSPSGSQGARWPNDVKPTPPSFQESQSAAAAAAGAQKPSSDSKFACVSFNSTTRIRLNNLPAEEMESIRAFMSLTWPTGISTAQPSDAANEIKFRHYPGGLTRHSQEHWPRLILGVVDIMLNNGWVVQAALPLSKSLCDEATSSDAIFFKKQSLPSSLPPCDWILMSFDRNENCAPILFGEFPSGFVAELRQVFLGQGDLKRYDLSGKTLDVKVRPFDKGTLAAQKMLISVLEFMERFGFVLYADFEMRINRWGRDHLIFSQSRTLIPEYPIWHS